MTLRTYASPESFKTALEQRLRASAKTGVGFARKRQLLVFDRFLARIAAVFGDAATLKGGLVLENLGDFMTFEVGPDELVGVTGPITTPLFPRQHNRRGRGGPHVPELERDDADKVLWRTQTSSSRTETVMTYSTDADLLLTALREQVAFVINRRPDMLSRVLTYIDREPRLTAALMDMTAEASVAEHAFDMHTAAIREALLMLWKDQSVEIAQRCTDDLERDIFNAHGRFDRFAEDMKDVPSFSFDDAEHLTEAPGLTKQIRAMQHWIVWAGQREGYAVSEQLQRAEVEIGALKNQNEAAVTRLELARSTLGWAARLRAWSMRPSFHSRGAATGRRCSHDVRVGRRS